MEIIKYLFVTPGIGGKIALTVIFISLICYSLTIRWISKSSE